MALAWSYVTFSSFDCVRQFEPERLLSFILFQIIRGNMTGDSEHMEAPFHRPPPQSLRTPKSTTYKQATDVRTGDEAAVSRALLGAPALILPLEATRGKHPSSVRF